jgi:hypothetical protein
MTARRLPMTATKAELLEKLRSNREDVVSKLRAIPPEKFEEGRYESGWNGRQILAHIASIEWTYPRLVEIAREAQSGSLTPGPSPVRGRGEESKPVEPAHRPARGGINDYNERQVEKRAQMSVEELITEFEGNREKTIAAFEAADDSLLNQPIKSAGGITGPLADVVSMIAIAHVDQHARDIAGK